MVFKPSNRIDLIVENHATAQTQCFLQVISMTTNPSSLTADINASLETEVAELIVTSLNLDMPAAEIAPVALLYGDEGLGLDSIDILELALAVSKKYGFQMRSDDADNVATFTSLRSLTAHIAKMRTK